MQSRIAQTAHQCRAAAVLGTGEATKRIRSGQMVTVDGTAGVIKLETSEE